MERPPPARLGLFAGAVVTAALIGCGGSEFVTSNAGDASTIGTQGDSASGVDSNGNPADASTADAGTSWCAGKTSLFCEDFDEYPGLSQLLGSTAWSTSQQTKGKSRPHQHVGPAVHAERARGQRAERGSGSSGQIVRSAQCRGGQLPTRVRLAHRQRGERRRALRRGLRRDRVRLVHGRRIRGGRDRERASAVRGLGHSRQMPEFRAPRVSKSRARPARSPRSASGQGAMPSRSITPERGSRSPAVSKSTRGARLSSRRAWRCPRSSTTRSGWPSHSGTMPAAPSTREWSTSSSTTSRSPSSEGPVRST